MAVLLPAILRDWRGFFMLGDHVLERVAVFLDYQNVHLTAHGLYALPQTPRHETLIHPLALAERLIAQRRRPGRLAMVRVFRGRPNPNRQPVPAAANDAQTARWERDPRVTVIRRDLNYRGWPAQAPQEKGVDVALAVDLIETALLSSYDSTRTTSRPASTRAARTTAADDAHPAITEASGPAQPPPDQALPRPVR